MKSETVLATAPSNISAIRTWLVDSGASHHYCNDIRYFKDLKTLNYTIKIVLGNEIAEQI